MPYSPNGLKEYDLNLFYHLVRTEQATEFPFFIGFHYGDLNCI